MYAAYRRIFRRCGVDALPAEAFSGAMGGSESIELMVATGAGEDHVLRCRACDYVANGEVARSRLGHEADVDADVDADLRQFPTPGVVTIEALAPPL